jgi:xanthine dehydrogenase/oxidase
MPKTDALIQCAGEATYTNDLPTDNQELFCAFVTSDIGIGEIENIDPTPALVRKHESIHQ